MEEVKIPKHRFQRDDIDVRTGYLIVNGTPTKETFEELKNNGNIIIGAWDADSFHPYALDSDVIIFYAKPISKERYDAHRKDFIEQFNIEFNEG